MTLVSIDEARLIVEIATLTKPTEQVFHTSKVLRLAETVAALWPFVEWVALLGCTLQNCQGDKHLPFCVPDQARKLLKGEKP